MVILGGIGTLIGPAIGAIFLVLLKHGIGSYTDHWHGFIGLILIFTVMAGGRGIWGQLQRLSSRRNPAHMTMVLVEQNFGFAAGLADEISIISRGRCVWSGTAAAVRADKQLQQRWLSV